MFFLLDKVLSHINFKPVIGVVKGERNQSVNRSDQHKNLSALLHFREILYKTFFFIRSNISLFKFIRNNIGTKKKKVLYLVVLCLTLNLTTAVLVFMHST